MSGGWAFLGETSKLAPVSVQRQYAFSFTVGKQGAGTEGRAVTAALILTVHMQGAPGEVCHLSAWKAGTLHTQQVVLDGNGLGSAIFS
jgi:hypothetical protein